MEIAPLFTAHDEGVDLHGSRCSSCGTAAFPPRRVCAVCAARESVVEDLPAVGRVRATTRLQTPPSGFDSPITVGVVELASGPVLFSLLVRETAPGTAVRGVAAPVRSGAAGFVFEPIEEAV